LLRKDTQVWENDILMITGLEAYKTTGDALRCRVLNLETTNMMGAIKWKMLEGNGGREEQKQKMMLLQK
jgi:hypothetical protein